jgi:hypothetical protein
MGIVVDEPEALQQVEKPHSNVDLVQLGVFQRVSQRA